MTNDNQHIPSGYKPSPLGIIPEDWEVKRLGEITTKIGSGITPRGGQNVYVTNGHPFMRSQNVSNGHLLLDDIVYIDDSTHQKQISTEIKPYDVLLNITGASIGRCAVAEESIVGGNVNQHVCIIRLKNKNLSYYVCSFLLSYLGQKQVDSFQAGGNREGLNYDQISSFKICVPPLNEINQITNILSLWDTAIAKQTALIEQLTLRKRGLMQQLLTGKKRLKGFEGEWKEVRLGEICPMERGEMLTSDNYLQGNIPVIAGGKEPAGFHSYANRQKNTITISCSGASAGFVAFHDVPIFATDCFTISESNAYNVWFIYHVLTNLQEKIYKLQTGGAQPHVHPKDVYPMKIHIPSIKEQNVIASVLVNADKEIEIQKQKLAAMQAQKKGLMQVLLTGERRISHER